MGLSLYAGGGIAGLASVPAGMTSAVETLPICTRLFDWLGTGALAAAIVATFLVPWLNRLVAAPAPAQNSVTAVSSASLPMSRS